MAATGPVLSAASRIGYLDVAAGGGERPFTVGLFTPPPPDGGGGYVLHSRRPVPPWQAGRMVRRRTTIPGRSTRCLTKDSLNRNI